MIDMKARVYLNTDEIADHLKKGVTERLGKCALMVEAEAKRLLSKGGATPVTSSGKREIKYTPSETGMPPHLRSGNLRGSIQAARQPDGSWVVGPATTAPYGRIHEFGGLIRVTAKMRMWLGMNLGIWKAVGSSVHIPARPFMRPALDNCRARFAKVFENIPLGGAVS